MTDKDIIDAWGKIREIDSSIPDNALDFMKDSAIERLSRKRLTLEEIDSHAKNYSEDRSIGDKEQDSECAYDFRMGMLTARNLLG